MAVSIPTSPMTARVFTSAIRVNDDRSTPINFGLEWRIDQGHPVELISWIDCHESRSETLRRNFDLRLLETRARWFCRRTDRSVLMAIVVHLAALSTINGAKCRCGQNLSALYCFFLCANFFLSLALLLILQLSIHFQCQIEKVDSEKKKKRKWLFDGYGRINNNNNTSSSNNNKSYKCPDGSTDLFILFESNWFRRTLLCHPTLPRISGQWLRRRSRLVRSRSRNPSG